MQGVPGARKGQRSTSCYVFLQVAVSRRHADGCGDFGAQLLYSFHSSRYPTKPADTAQKFDAAKNNHIIFVRKNKFFEVPLVHNGVELSEAELEVYVLMHLPHVIDLLIPQHPVKSKTSSSWLETNLAFQLVLLPAKTAIFGQR